MTILKGNSISGGIAVGPLLFYRRQNQKPAAYSADELQEKERLRSAQEETKQELLSMAASCRTQGEEEAAALLDAHALLAQDDTLTGLIFHTLEEKHCNAEYAVQQAGDRFAAMFAAMDDDYMQARSADIRDVTQRIIEHLMGTAPVGPEADESIILAADDLTPSEFLRFDRTKILGILLKEGSANSHTAILARTRGIPVIGGLGEALDLQQDRRFVCMDGETGEAVIDPDEQTTARFRGRSQKREKAFDRMEAMKGQEAVTPQGQRIRLCCNLNSPDEMAAVLASDAEGIGLLRSEFLYLSSAEAPTEEEQFAAYWAVVSAMNGRRVVIRTLDIGGDKQAAYLKGEKEENPAMGMRGVRLCLAHPDLFRVQLRAIYRASAFGEVGILLPMITSVSEVRSSRHICAEVMQELRQKKVPYRPDTPIGIMIETPASVWMAPELAAEADFFSVGTNDLTQYTLACDRQRSDLDSVFDPHHPAVLRAVRAAADAAHAASIPIGICGEAAADPKLLETFLAMGIDELSVPPAAVLPLRAAVRGIR